MGDVGNRYVLKDATSAARAGIRGTLVVNLDPLEVLLDHLQPAKPTITRTGRWTSTSVKDISPHSAPELHVCGAHWHSAQASLVRDYLD